MNMQELWSFAGMIFITLGFVYLQPMFWLIILLVWFQQRRNVRQQRAMFGLSPYSAAHHTVRALLLGSVGGVGASLLLTLLGIDLSRLGLAYIWPVALALLLFDMRLLCFAYAGGLVALSHLLFSWPEVDVPQLVALIAVLHLTEGLLIRASGADCFWPVLLERHDSFVGGFSLQNFWPLPLALLLAVPTLQLPQMAGQLMMPQWWPFFPGIAPPQELTYLLLPVVAALGYGDLAVTCRPEESSRRAAGHLLLYGLSLLVLAFLARHWPWVCWVAALWAPVGHEWMVQRQMKREMSGVALYARPQRGVLVLEVAPGSAAAKAGIQREDVLLAVDDFSLHSREDLFVALSNERVQEILVLRGKIVLSFRCSWPSELKKLGLILLPDGRPDAYLKLGQLSLIASLWKRLKS